MLSYWEKESFTDYDFIVIGGGIVGISTAISLKENLPNASILILERGSFPSGASTKNAGFACFGSLTELLDDFDILGADGTLGLVTQRWEGLKKLRERVGDKNLDYHGYGGYELIGQEELSFLNRIDEVNELLSKLFDKPVFELQNYKIDQFRFEKSKVKALIYNQYEGQLHTGNMMKALISKAQQMGISILTGTEVVSFNTEKGKTQVIAKNTVSDTTIEFNANKLAICTNAFTDNLIPDLDISPGRGIVLVTKPIENLPFKGVFHIDKGYYYFRNEGKRVLFGGGRNLDFEGETTTDFSTNQFIVDELKRQLEKTILPNHTFEVEHTWAGIMAFGSNKTPVIKKHSDNIYLGVRLGGMGVAIGSSMGEKLANLMLQ